MNSAKLCLPLLILFCFLLAYLADVRTGTYVLRAMHDRYAKTWYETLTFTQKSTTYNPDGTSKAETWYEALKAPGKLRIDIGNPADGDGFLLVDGTVTIFKAGKEVGTRPQVNMLLVLGVDVYRQAPETTASVAKTEGYDLTKVHEESWEGRPVYVVGAEKCDFMFENSWVEKEAGCVARLLYRSAADAG